MEIRIKEIAKRNKDWSLIELHKNWLKVFKDGIHHTTIYSWQNNKSQPSWENIEKLCFILEAKIGDLFQPLTIQYKEDVSAKRTKSRRK